MVSSSLPDVDRDQRPGGPGIRHTHRHLLASRCLWGSAGGAEGPARESCPAGRPHRCVGQRRPSSTGRGPASDAASADRYRHGGLRGALVPARGDPGAGHHGAAPGRRRGVGRRATAQPREHALPGSALGSDLTVPQGGLPGRDASGGATQSGAELRLGGGFAGASQTAWLQPAAGRGGGAC